MSGYMGDLTSYLTVGNNSAAAAAGYSKSASDSMGLDMTDFLTLMVTELTNQSIDQTADTTDMLNQLVQMQMVQALTNMTDASIMSYAASLVGKEVTVGQYDENGELQELVGLVTGTGTMGGDQVVFVNDKYYYMNEIMAVGRLPEVELPEEDSKVEGAGGAESGSQTDSVEGTGGTESGGDTSGGTDGTGETAPVAPEDTGT